MARKTIFIARRDGHAMREEDLRVKELGGGGEGPSRMEGSVGTINPRGIGLLNSRKGS
jgi:hypothetical protein